MAAEADKEFSKRSAYIPSRYMRQRHPHLFSDSAVESNSSVTREILSYHLETLTSQKQEAAFEAFAHRMCEKFVAPNLRPQTGPTGGGDGKTDAETYPVAEEIALRWFVPESLKAGERFAFAFAFSAKKDWRTKVKSDVKSIASTARDYDHIVFVTNQFVPAKDSASVQDELKKQYGIPVTILDRTWLLDRVFDHHSLNIAVEELGVGAGTERQQKKVGPKDYERQQEFVELERAIQDGTKYQGQPHALAEDALRAATLARGLEMPKSEINGLFDRAVRIAKDRKLANHVLAAIYAWAWTSYFWFDDHLRTNELYDEIEVLALSSDESGDLERLSNILPLLRMSVRTNNLVPADAKLDERTKQLTNALERVSAMTGRPNNALHAKAMLLMTRMTERVTADQPDPLVDIWKEFSAVIREAEGLGAFPFLSIANALIEIGEFVPESDEFDVLYAALTDALPDEIAKMGEASAQEAAKLPRLQLAFSIPGHGPVQTIEKTYSLYSDQCSLPDFAGDAYFRRLQSQYIAHGILNSSMLREGAEHLREQNGMTPVVLTVSNDGVLATDVRVVLTVDSGSGMRLKRSHQLLTMPNRFGYQSRPQTKVSDGPLEIQTLGKAITATVRYSKLQSGERLTAPALYLLYVPAALKVLQFQVFADELEVPMYVELPLQVEVVDTETTVAAVWEWLNLEGAEGSMDAI